MLFDFHHQVQCSIVALTIHLLLHWLAGQPRLPPYHSVHPHPATNGQHSQWNSKSKEDPELGRGHGQLTC